MLLNKLQLDRLSSFLVDLAKILFASAFIGFVVPGASGQVSIPIFILGTLSAFGCLVIGLKLLEELNHNQL